jgi:hypothetical protein
LIAATRRVAAQGPAAYQKRAPSDRRSVIFSPQASSSLRQLAVLLEHPGRFAQRPGALARAGDVVDRQRTDHHAERAVVEGQGTHVGTVKLDPLGHALEGRVLAGNLLGVSRLVQGAPDVDADRSSTGQALGRHQQHRPAAAADVEQPLVSSELELIE